MLFDVKPLPGDPILALMTAYRADDAPNKVDLGVGVYQDNAGHTPVLRAVAAAEARVLAAQTTKAYVGIAGAASFNTAMTQMVFGTSHQALADERLVTVQSAGGSGGLRVAAELIKSLRPDSAVWVTTPTWPNHVPLLTAAGVQIKQYRYYDPASGLLDRDGMLEDLANIPSGDVVLLHGCCHNPTGADLDAQLWSTVATLCRDKNLLPFVDTAYQGFGESLDGDAQGIRTLADIVPEMITVTSCSKNFGLYRERVGALTLLTRTADHAVAAKSHLLKIVRSMISMPPDHGARVVAEILNDTGLSADWRAELTEMRERMHAQRRGFVDALKPHGLDARFGFVADQVGMFSLLGISSEQIKQLRDDWHVYIVGSSRINVAGLTAGKVDYIAEALAAVLSG
ncbi:MAG: amino acid aminotransferase [Pseudomonadota bacterium]